MLFRSLRILAAIILIVAAGILVGWWNTRMPSSRLLTFQPGQLPQQAAPVSTGADSQVATPAPFKASGSLQPPLPSTLSTSPESVTNWEEQVEAILNSPNADRAKAAALLQIFPQLPEDGQSEVAATVAPLLPDAEFADLGQYLTNATVAEPVMDVLLAGLLSRPDAVKLPWLLTIAQDEANPRAPDAVYLLQALLGQDNGKNWGQWAASVDRYLQTGPE